MAQVHRKPIVTMVGRIDSQVIGDAGVLARIWWAEYNHAHRLPNPEFCCCPVLVWRIDLSKVCAAAWPLWDIPKRSNSAWRPAPETVWGEIMGAPFLYDAWNFRLDEGWVIYRSLPSCFSKLCLPVETKTHFLSAHFTNHEVMAWLSIIRRIDELFWKANEISPMIITLDSFMQRLFLVSQLNSRSLHALLVPIEAGTPTFVNPLHPTHLFPKNRTEIS